MWFNQKITIIIINSYRDLDNRVDLRSIQDQEMRSWVIGYLSSLLALSILRCCEPAMCDTNQVTPSLSQVKMVQRGSDLVSGPPLTKMDHLVWSTGLLLGNKGGSALEIEGAVRMQDEITTIKCRAPLGPPHRQAKSWAQPKELGNSHIGEGRKHEL